MARRAWGVGLVILLVELGIETGVRGRAGVGVDGMRGLVMRRDEVDYSVLWDGTGIAT